MVNIGEDHGRCEELGNTTSKNPSGYGGRYVEKGERKLVSIYEMVNCKEGVREGHSNECHNDDTTLCREGPLICS
ncbi:hypothetical protein EXW57_26030 [Bacillus mycoides]|nr:hypothetical protein EXW57_26030 [Bacillus mycoides]